MSAWWSSLAERERRLLLLAAAVLATGLFYGLLWAPLQRGVALRSQRVAALRADLAWMRSAAVRLVSLRAQAAPPAAGAAVAPDAPLARQVADSARAAGLSAVIELPAGAAHPSEVRAQCRHALAAQRDAALQRRPQQAVEQARGQHRRRQQQQAPFAFGQAAPPRAHGAAPGWMRSSVGAPGADAVVRATRRPCACNCRRSAA